MAEQVSTDSRTDLIAALLARTREEGLYAVLRFEETRGRSVAVEGDRVEAVESVLSGGLGIQVFTPTGHNGFAAVDDPDEARAGAALERAMAAARAAEGANLSAMPGILSAEKTVGRHVPGVPFAFDHLTVGEMREATLAFARRAGERVSGGAGRAGAQVSNVAVRTGFGLSRSDWRIARSDGTDVTFVVPRSRVGVVLTAREGGQAVRTNASATGTSYEVLTDEGRAEEFLERVRRAGELARDLLAAPAGPAGSFPLLIDFALAKGLAHEAFGHAAETDGLESSILGRDGRFRVGERFGSENISIIDESIDADNAFQPFSSNGVPRRRAVILDHGVLTDALADIHTADRAGTGVTGAGRQSGFAEVPLPRMTNIRLVVDDPVPVPAGKDFYDWTPEEVRDLLVSAGDLPEGRKVLFLSGYRGGQVNPALGDFVFNSAAQYELSRDAVTLYKPGIFSGRIEAALHSIERGYGPLRLDAAGTCVKAGQGVPSSGGSHHFLLISENPDIRIGGRT